jgi:hypothetical protein
MTRDIPQLSNEENEILVGYFTEQEVYDTIFQMEKNKKRWVLMVFRHNFTKNYGML